MDFMVEYGGVLWQNRDVILNVSETLANVVGTAIEKAECMDK